MNFHAVGDRMWDEDFWGKVTAEPRHQSRISRTLIRSFASFLAKKDPVTEWVENGAGNLLIGFPARRKAGEMSKGTRVLRPGSSGSPGFHASL
jgi:hypothetical protein